MPTLNLLIWEQDWVLEEFQTEVQTLIHLTNGEQT